MTSPRALADLPFARRPPLELLGLTEDRATVDTAYAGFGWTLVTAASNNDIEMLLGASVVAVFVVLVTQLISDIGYVFLNPRIRLS